MKKYVFNLEPSPKDDRDYLLESIYPNPVTLPKTFDTRKELPSVRDQGMEGTCSAQAAACMKEWQERVDVNFYGHMSPQFIYNLRNNYGTAGMTPRDTMKILYHVGVIPEKDYPYGKEEDLDINKLDKKTKKYAERYKIAGYAKVNTLDSLKKALIANGPCYIAFPTYNPENMEFWKPEYPNQPSYGGHAVAVVGWTKDSFIIRNSWGTSWGDGGYTYYKFEDWGMHWEAWTTLDEDSTQEKLDKKTKRIGFFKRLFCKKLRKTTQK